MELIVETVLWQPNTRRARRRDEEMIAVRIAYAEADLRGRAKRLGAIWRPQQRLWEMRWLDAKRLGIGDRVQRSERIGRAATRDLPAYPAIYRWIVASIYRSF